MRLTYTNAAFTHHGVPMPSARGAERRYGDRGGAAAAVVVTAPIGQELAIGIVEVEVTRELRRSRLAGVAAVAPGRWICRR